jgi:hypothetical protein
VFARWAQLAGVRRHEKPDSIRKYARLTSCLRRDGGCGPVTMQVLQLARSVILGPTAAPKVYTITATLRGAISYNVDVLVFDGCMIRNLGKLILCFL